MKLSKRHLLFLIILIVIVVGLFFAFRNIIIFPGLQDISLRKPIFIRYAYGSYPDYDIYNKNMPLFYDNELQKYFCKKNNEVAVEKRIFPTESVDGIYPGGWSRVAYYCPQQKIYFIRDFPGAFSFLKGGYTAFTVYGPFKGKPE